MRTDTGQVFKLEDYRPSDYLIPETRLAFRLSPDQTSVVARMTVKRRDPAAPAVALVLDGDGPMALTRVEIDGKALDGDAYRFTP
jgi:aminopeptidase N